MQRPTPCLNEYELVGAPEILEELSAISQEELDAGEAYLVLCRSQLGETQPDPEEECQESESQLESQPTAVRASRPVCAEAPPSCLNVTLTHTVAWQLPPLIGT